MNNGIVYVLVGNRDNNLLCRSIASIRKFSNIPITVWSDREITYQEYENVSIKVFERKKYPGSHREENRNSSLFRLIALKESSYENTLYLDNDIMVVHKDFFEGFNIAKNYGITMVENPRQFIKSDFNIGDLDIGADVNSYDKDYLKDMPKCMMALNMGVMFYNKMSKLFLEELIWEQENNPSRGQAGLYRTIWKTKKFPYALPFQWLVCKKHVGINNPLALHCGHPNILDWYNRAFQ